MTCEEQHGNLEEILRKIDEVLEQFWEDTENFRNYEQ